ncbi:Ff.00g048620.m01.CDS01 [Fusarium sp. VM40]|nr:Ff.00g048620.m01.CDS01 [Fusarium sp. VM40]
MRKRRWDRIDVHYRVVEPTRHLESSIARQQQARPYQSDQVTSEGNNSSVPITGNSQRLSPGSPADYRIRYLRTNHSLYGTASRHYLFIGTSLSSQAQEPFIFLTLITCDGKGIPARLAWFLDPLSYKLQRPYHKNRNTFVTWTQATAVASIGKEYVEGDMHGHQLSPRELCNLRKTMDHQLNHHLNLVDCFKDLHLADTRFEFEWQRENTYRDIDRVLGNSESCLDPECRLLELLKK